jgi:hypothetical protein
MRITREQAVRARTHSGCGRASASRTHLDIRLRIGEQWRYQPPANHSVAWIALHAGKLVEIVGKGGLTVFEESNGALEFAALEDAGFVLGSTVKHPTL